MFNRYLNQEPFKERFDFEIIEEFENYVIVKKLITSEDEAIPMILQYMPNIKVLAPDSLKDKILELINSYINL